ncbi:hypothetical protein GCM10010327_07200 [Streptomyces nitrosporeus]|nr:hypothetical protein GCM10010327_07200 [Streptomyces nitrosporeus]
MAGPDGTRRAVAADAVRLSPGSAPAAPPGGLLRGPDGHRPPDGRHPRVPAAGAPRPARYQRIMTATGPGAEAAPRAHHALR